MCSTPCEQPAAGSPGALDLPAGVTLRVESLQHTRSFKPPQDAHHAAELASGVGGGGVRGTRVWGWRTCVTSWGSLRPWSFRFRPAWVTKLGMVVGCSRPRGLGSARVYTSAPAPFAVIASPRTATAAALASGVSQPAREPAGTRLCSHWRRRGVKRNRPRPMRTAASRR